MVCLGNIFINTLHKGDDDDDDDDNNNNNRGEVSPVHAMKPYRGAEVSLTVPFIFTFGTRCN
jgi:hypothetical protein